MATTTTTVKHHPDIGPVKGILKDGVAQYLGVKYASLADRFAPPRIVETYDTTYTIDATRLGPAVVPIPNGAEAEQGLIQHALEYDKSTLRTSDTEGLNLNITVPLLDSDAPKLPVFVFIHGGGFFLGSATWPQYDFARFVRLSRERGRPVIAVGLNYRLGAPGLLTSKEMRDAGYKPNNALLDQHCALRWIKKYISGFGGDDKNVTLAGQSAGGVSVAFHMLNDASCFQRAILMSGTDLVVSPLPVEVAEQNYESAMKLLGLHEKSTEERIGALKSMDASELREKLMGVPMLPVINVENASDLDMSMRATTFNEWRTGKVAMPTTVESVMIGDCQFDGNIQGLRLMHRKSGIASAFRRHVSNFALPKDVAEKLLKDYGITSDLDDETAFVRVLEFTNDVGFLAPTVTYAQSLAAKSRDDMQATYVYHFNEPNPWDGPWKGYAIHILDVAFLFQNFNEFLDEKQRTSAQVFALDVCNFMYGDAPWEAWKGDRKMVKVIGPEGKAEVIEEEPTVVGRRRTVFELAEHLGADGMDRLSELSNSFLQPPQAS